MPPISPASRSGPLITWLVVFVLLWLVGTVFAIYYYVDGTKARQDLDTLSKQYSEILPRTQINSDDVTQLKSMRTNDAGGFNSSMTVFDILKKERDDLAAKIDGGNAPDLSYKTASDTLDDAKTKLAKSANIPTLPPTLNQTVATLTQALIARQNEINSLNGQLKQAQNTAIQASAQMQANQTELTKAMEAARSEAQQASATLATDRNAKDDQIKKMIGDTETAQKQAQDQLAQAQSSMSDLTKKNVELQRQIDNLREKLGQHRSDTSSSVIRQSDGEIVRVPGNNTVYINLGQGDQISPGLTFEVYDRAEGVPPLGDPTTDENLPVGKGAIEVVRVGAGSSECRIVSQSPGQTIHEGDIIANLVYDKNTKYQFFVYGDFDLDQNGVSTPQDGEVVKRLVAQWGGKLTDKINADTDFVVLGKEPQVIVPSKEEANDPIIQAKAQASQAASDAYQAVKQQALDFHIPILNQNRFLYYVGYYETAKR